MSKSQAHKKTLALPLHFLNEDREISFDIYVWAGGKPVLYCRADDVNLKDRIQRLKSKKGLEHFHVQKSDYATFITYMAKGLEDAYQNSSGKSLSEQVSDIYFQQRGLLIVFAADPASKVNYSVLRSTCAPFYQFFSNDNRALEELYKCSFESSDYDLFLTHSVRAAALSSRLIAELGVDEAGKPIFDVIMGAFLHDFGYLEEEWPLTVPLSPSENSAYKNHPLTGVKFLNYDHVIPWVRNVISKHEEHIDGTGFPAGIREEDIDPTIVCVAVACAFDVLRTLHKKSYEDALKQMLIDKMGAYPLNLLQKLQGIVKDIS